MGLLVEVVEDFLIRFFRETFLLQFFADHVRICVYQDRKHRMIAGQAVGNPGYPLLDPLSFDVSDPDRHRYGHGLQKTEAEMFP